MKPVSLPRSSVDVQRELTWRLLRLAFWLSAGTALLYLVANLQRGRFSLALIDAVSLTASTLSYGVSTRLDRPQAGLQAIAVVAWLSLAVTITLHGGLRSPAIAWIVVLAPLLMLAGVKFALAMAAATVALIAALYVAEASGWTPPYVEVPLLQRAVSAVLITCLFALSARYALRWRTRLADDLEAVRDAAIEDNRLKGRFIANLNHEIRTPMNALVAAAQLLGRQQMGSEQRVLVQAVQHSADHLLALVNDVLDYERLEAGEVRLDAVEFSLRELTGATLGMFSAQAEAKQLSLTLDLQHGLPDLWIGDPTRLRQVMCNLVSNSIKFTPAHGHVVLRVADSSARSDLGSAVCFEVVDSGPGITADAQAGLFQPYRQGDASIARRFGGTGLGLSICKELLLLMKGTIEVESQPGAGSTFRVAVPLVRGDSKGQRAATGPMRAPELPAELTVMLVEDDPVNQIVMEAVLRDLGVRALTAGSGEQALQLLAEEAVDVVLMDCHLPGMDGLAATRHWRGEEARRQRARLPVIGLTGDVYAGAREACLEAGMDDYLTKPVSRDDLGAALARWAPAGQRSKAASAKPARS